MTLKNSFLADAPKQQQEENGKSRKTVFCFDVREDMKRRNWIFGISFLVFFCCFPGYLLLRLNSILSNYENADAEGLLLMQRRMDDVVSALFHSNGFLPVLIIFLAVLIGMQGFAYLHNKKQVDFYHSQPVSRKRRFTVLWFDGVVIFVVTYWVNMLLGMMVATVFGSMSGTIMTGAIKAFCLYLLLFLGIYHLAMIAVLLTGNTLVSLLMMGLLLGYELAARAITVLMASSFFVTYGSGEENKIFDTIFSPIVNIYKYIILAGRQGRYYSYEGKIYTYGNIAVGLLLLAIVFGIVSYFLYKMRASESHGNSISFPKMKEILRFALLLVFGIFCTYAVYFVAGESVVLGILGAVFSVALGHAVIQLIYEVDFRAIRKKLVTAVVSLVSVIVVFLAFRYDWIGYDSRIPKQSKVESVYVSLVAESFGDCNYVMQDGTEIYRWYRARNMEITDLDTIYALLENRERITRDTKTYDRNYENMEIKFRFRNGKTENRMLYINYEENMELLNEIYHMDAYQLANNQVMEENFVDNYRIISATYNNGFGNVTAPIDVDMHALIEAYKKDVENADYEEVYYNYPKAQISLLGVGMQNEEYRNSWNILIYDSYKNTIALLEQAGINHNNVFDNAYRNRIQKIEIRQEDYVTLPTSETELVSYSQAQKTVIYTNPEVIGKILENTVPSTNRWWSSKSRSNNDEYSVLIYTPNPYDGSDYYIDEVYFQKGKIPQFVLEDLEKIPFGEEQIIK